MTSNTILYILCLLLIVLGCVFGGIGIAFGTSYNLDGTETLELVEGGYLDISTDHYGHNKVIIGHTDLCTIEYLFSPDGNKINACNLKTNTYYKLYRERFLLAPSRYYLIKETKRTK